MTRTRDLADIGPGVPTGFRNAIINGGFDIWQRGTSATATAGSTTYFADRWACFAAGATVFPYQSAGLAGTASRYAAYVNGVAGNTATTFLQRIESSNTKLLSGSTFTVSAKVSSPNARNINIYVQSANAADNFSTKTAVGSVTVAVVSGMNTVKATFTANAACANGIEIGFEFGAVTSGTFALGQVQLEVGSVATPFEQRPIGTELALCQRYYQPYPYRGLAEAVGILGYSAGGGAYYMYGASDFSVPMRTTPVTTLTSVTFRAYTSTITSASNVYFNATATGVYWCFSCANSGYNASAMFINATAASAEL